MTTANTTVQTDTEGTNYVRIAVDRVGGPTKAANIMGVSNTTIHSWIKQRRISNIDHARKMAEESKVELQRLRPTL